MLGAIQIIQITRNIADHVAPHSTPALVAYARAQLHNLDDLRQPAVPLEEGDARHLGGVAVGPSAEDHPPADMGHRGPPDTLQIE